MKMGKREDDYDGKNVNVFCYLDFFSLIQWIKTQKEEIFINCMKMKYLNIWDEVIKIKIAKCSSVDYIFCHKILFTKEIFNNKFLINVSVSSVTFVINFK